MREEESNRRIRCASLRTGTHSQGSEPSARSSSVDRTQHDDRVDTPLSSKPAHHDNLSVYRYCELEFVRCGTAGHPLRGCPALIKPKCKNSS